MKKRGRLGSRCISSSNITAGGPYDGGSRMMPNYIPRTRKSETSLLMKKILGESIRSAGQGIL